MRALAIVVGVGLGCWSPGCGKAEPESAARAPVEAQAIGPAECAACGMVVREQPAPRGQVVHRDGTRAHFCSIDDMLQYVHAPSPHGQVTDVFVETLEPGHDPADTSSEERPWAKSDAAGVSYVRGVERPGIMGPPVLVYASRAAAEAAAKAHGGEVTSWPELRATGRR